MAYSILSLYHTHSHPILYKRSSQPFPTSTYNITSQKLIFPFCSPTMALLLANYLPHKAMTSVGRCMLYCMVQQEKVCHVHINSICYLKNHWSKHRLVCTHFDAFFILIPNMAMKSINFVIFFKILIFCNIFCAKLNVVCTCRPSVRQGLLRKRL